MHHLCLSRLSGPLGHIYSGLAQQRTNPSTRQCYQPSETRLQASAASLAIGISRSGSRRRDPTSTTQGVSPNSPNNREKSVGGAPGRRNAQHPVEAPSTICSRIRHGRPARSSGKILARQRRAPSKEATNPSGRAGSTSFGAGARNTFFFAVDERVGRQRPDFDRRHPREISQPASNTRKCAPSTKTPKTAPTRLFGASGGVLGNFRLRTSFSNTPIDFLDPQNPMTKSIVSSNFRPEPRQTARRLRSS